MDTDPNQVGLPNYRTWTTHDIDEFVVGRVHGGYDFNQIVLYIRLNNPDLNGITAAELERFWNDVLVPNRFHIARWTRLVYQHPEVQRVLNRIRAMLIVEGNEISYDD